MTIRTAVGSKNPVKIAAAREALGRAWGDVHAIGVDVPTGVSAMPLSAAECVEGARNRAIAARQTAAADFGVGLEGGVEQSSFGLFLVGWVVLVDGHGREGIGSSGRIRLPETIAARVLNGEELGPVMDEVVQRHNTRHQEGAIGILTKNLVVRQQMFETAISLALAPFVAQEYY